MNPDVLVMTATPFRALCRLTLYAIWIYRYWMKLPGGRKPIKTAWRRAASAQRFIPLCANRSWSDRRRLSFFRWSRNRKTRSQSRCGQLEIMQKTFFSQQSSVCCMVA
jgi:hypothetical protein